jgi:hypothetical protein
MTKESEKVKGLHDLFVDSFMASELKNFLLANGYEEVVHAVKEEASAIAYFSNVVQVLERRGLIDEQFFARLARELSLKEAYIRSLQESWLVEEKMSPQSSGSTALRGPREMIHAEPPAPQHQTTVTPVWSDLESLGGHPQMSSRMETRRAAPVRIREVPPSDPWFDASSTGEETNGVCRSLIEQERDLPRKDRAESLYFDLSRYSTAGNAIDPVLKWVDRYWVNRLPNDFPVTLMVIGEGVKPSDRDRLVESGAHYLDLRRPSIRRLMGVAPRDHQLYRLLQNLSGYPIPPDVVPFGYQPPVSIPPHSLTPQPAAAPTPVQSGDWQTYAKPPAHIDRKDVEGLFQTLAEDQPWWERDS